MTKEKSKETEFDIIFWKLNLVCGSISKSYNIWNVLPKLAHVYIFDVEIINMLCGAHGY